MGRKNSNAVFAGNAGVGKTSLMLRMTEDAFPERKSIVCPNVTALPLDGDGQVPLSDIDGEERLRSVTQIYLRE